MALPETDAAFTPPQRNPAAATANPGSPHDRKPRLRRDALLGALILALAMAACVIGYLAATVPGAWFPHESVKAWSVRDLALARGIGRVVGDELVVNAPDPSGIALITLTTEIRSSDYAGIAWIVAGLADDADVRLLWRSNFQPDKLNSVPVRIEGGRTQPTVVLRNAGWIGRVTGLALAIHGTPGQPVRIRGVIAEPMGAMEMLGDRFREWLAFESWNGTSINTITGGADSQDLPLPVLLALGVGVAGVVVLALRRWRPATFNVATPAVLVAFFLVGWLVLDARWTLNLMRQERATASLYAGKNVRERHLANEDGALFEFIEKARAVLPQVPVRIFIAADADYFRGRAAYHLYPNNVYFNPRSNMLPPADQFHAGDWLLVFQQRGIQFDAQHGKIRWDDNQTLSAELKLVGPGAALFAIR